MGKRKLQRFAELKILDRVFEPEGVYIKEQHPLKGNWSKVVFNNSSPIVLELGCGKGEYTVNLAKKYPHKNFIGIDIKGARIWRGVKTINEENITNAAFLRVQIEQLMSFFDENEVSEIWLTFPDPQLQKSRQRKRLTSPKFLDIYEHILESDGCVNLKTDSYELYEYTNEVLKEKALQVLLSTDHLYESNVTEDVKAIKTTYEKIFLKLGKQICYVKFKF